MKSTVGALIACTLFAVSPAAGQFYLPPQCEINTKHFLVNQAQLYVKAASEAKSETQKSQALQDAMRVLQDAITRGEVGEVGVWYFLGRTYILQNDFAGADSAFDKVETMMPECGDDTDTHRNMAWVPVYNSAVEALRAQDYTTARQQLWQANLIYHKEPFVPYYLGSLFAQESQPDSSIKYFREAIEQIEAARIQAVRDSNPQISLETARAQAQRGETGDTVYADAHDLSIFNIGRLFHQQDKLDSAVVWYEAYRKLHPDDMDAVRGLALLYDQLGQSRLAADPAMAEDSTVADSLLQLSAGLFDTLLTRSTDATSEELFSTGVTLFNAGNYDLAVKAFSLGLEKNPYHRDGIYNLGQSYFAIASPTEEPDTPMTAEETRRRTEAAEHMLEVAKRLVVLDPQNSSTLQMLAQAWRLVGDDDSTLAAIEAMNALNFDIAVMGFNRTSSGIDVSGSISNLTDKEITVPPVKFEFIDAQGTVIGTEVFSGTTLAPMAEKEFNFTPVGEAIVAWRYQVNSSE
jgi:tetratricopeptide (TPR) repeat protein